MKFLLDEVVGTSENVACFFIVFVLINFWAVSLLGIFRKEHFVSSGKDTAQALKKNSKEKTGHERTESKAESLAG